MTFPRVETEAADPTGDIEAAPGTLFDHGPFARTARWVPVLRSREADAQRRALVGVLLAWLPLAVLSMVQELVLNDPRGRTFLLDYGAHARFLVALPLLAYAPAVTLPKLRFVMRRFVETGAVPEREFERLDVALAEAARGMQSRVAELTLLVVAYALVLFSAIFLREQLLMPWRELGLRFGAAPSLAGYWYLFVSAPLLVALVLGWIRRQYLWGRLLARISRLDLELVPAHPDRLGGLGFIKATYKGYWPISVGLGAVMAGAVANHVFYAGTSPLLFRYQVAALVLVLLLLIIVPMLPLYQPLRRAKKRGRNEYGLLAARMGRTFERAWVVPADWVGVEALKAQDFSATTDLYQIVGNVNDMGRLPFSTKDLAMVVLPALGPMVVVAFAILPREEVLEQLTKVVKLVL